MMGGENYSNIRMSENGGYLTVQCSSGSIPQNLEFGTAFWIEKCGALFSARAQPHMNVDQT